MKKHLSLLPLLIAFTIQLHAQRQNDQDIQDSVIGWWGNSRFDHLKPQMDPLGKKKEATLNEIVKWMKTSYTPVGGLGTSSRYIGKKGYGVSFLVWNVSHEKEWTEPDGKFKPIAEENKEFLIVTNKLFGAFPIPLINAGDEKYYTVQPNGYADNKGMMEDRKDADPRIHPNAYPYITWVNDWCTVYLAPNNKLPWIPVSKAELLQKAEAGLNEKFKTANDYDKVNITKYINNIHLLRARYSASLNQPAVIRDMQVTMTSFELDPDLFRIDDFGAGLHHAFEVFKLDADTYAKMSGEQPQWVSIAFPFERKEDGNQHFEMFTAMSQNINYDYIYNYFFNPEKIKGIPYTAADAAGLKNRLDAYRRVSNRNQTLVSKKQGIMTANTVLSDDFSQESPGSKPAGWFFNSTGQPHTVTTLPGEKGNWLRMGTGNALSSTTLKTLPANFNLEYDLVTSAFDGRWGATISMEMSGSVKGSDGIQHNSNLEIKITAGNQSAWEAAHDYRGEVRIALHNTPSKMDYNEKGGYLDTAQPFFTSTKRKLHVQLKNTNGALSLFFNGKEFVNSSQFKTLYGKPCGDCTILSGLQYSKFTLQSSTQDGSPVECYIGNIKITKE